MSLKESTNTGSTGTAAKFGAADINFITKYFNGDPDVFTAVIDSSTTIQNGKLHVSSITNTGVSTFPTTTDTLVGRVTTDILENKTISGVDNTITDIDDSSLSANVVLLTGAQALSDKTLTSPIINGAIMGDATDMVLNTGTGTKIGTAPTQKLGFFNAVPIVQPAANADTSGAILTDLEIEVNQIKQLLRDLGLMAT